MNIKLAAGSSHFGLVFAAALASVATYPARHFGNALPFRPPFVVLGRAALPLGAGAAGHSAIARRHVARVRAKLSWLTLKGSEPFTAGFAALHLGFFAIPSFPMIASHAAKLRIIRPIQVNAIISPAPLTCPDDLGEGLPLAALHSGIPRRAAIRAGAFSRAILSRLPTDKRLGALFAGMVNWLVHMRNITGTGFRIKYFAIACRRVDEATRQPDLFVEHAPKPVQEGMDL